MKELSLHILDLVENSLKAQAKIVNITIAENMNKDLLSIEIVDDGKGMDKDFLEKVTDPFITTRKTRKVGLGISLTKAAAIRCNGTFKIYSKPGEGTKVTFTFKHSHIDRAPLGNMGQTISAIINQSDNSEIVYTHMYNNSKFVLDTREVKKILDGVNIKSTEILLWLVEYVNENLKTLIKNNKNT